MRRSRLVGRRDDRSMSLLAARARDRMLERPSGTKPSFARGRGVQGGIDPDLRTKGERVFLAAHDNFQLVGTVG